jgi:threonine synthase
LAGYVSPESAAALAAVPLLRSEGLIENSDHVVVFDTGAGHKSPAPHDLPKPPILDADEADFESLLHSFAGQNGA